MSTPSSPLVALLDAFCLAVILKLTASRKELRASPPGSSGRESELERQRVKEMEMEMENGRGRQSQPNLKILLELRF